MFYYYTELCPKSTVQGFSKVIFNAIIASVGNMNGTVKIWGREIPKDLLVFLIISVLLGVVMAVESTSLNNRLYEDLDFTIMQRAMLETPRELPGLLCVVIIGFMNSLGDIKIAAVANLIGGCGLLLFGMAPNQFSFILVTLVIYSTGQHIYLPLTNTIAMTFASGENYGQRLGQVQSLGSISIIVASAVLYLLYKLFDVSYQTVFTISGVAMLLAGVLFLMLDKGGTRGKIVAKRKFIVRKEFKLYYVLATVNGARKQITITFVPWLLIDTFQQPVTAITALFFFVCVLNVFFKPWFGKLIDEKGERFALQLESIVMFTACLGFAFAKTLFSPQVALLVVFGCYIIDKLMESASMARATYVRKLSKEASDVARTLAAGQSFDHAVSMLIPLFAGYVWYTNGVNGYVYVFLGALAISFINFYVAGKLPKKEKTSINGG